MLPVFRLYECPKCYEPVVMMPLYWFLEVPIWKCVKCGAKGRIGGSGETSPRG
jgi:hypothetical protein